MPTSLHPRLPTRVLAPALALLLAVGLMVALAPPASAVAPTNDARPTVSGTLRVGKVLTATTGEWTPAPASYEWQWFWGNGDEIQGATFRRFRLRPVAVGRQVHVRVRAVAADNSHARATSTRTAKAKPGIIRIARAPRVTGVPRWTRTLRVRTGGWRPGAVGLSVRWLRDGRPIPGAKGRRFRPRTSDVNHRIAARVTARKMGYATRNVRSKARKIGYRVGVHRRVAYHVETRGRITTSLATFKRQAQQTFAHAQGWRNGGTQFRRVAKGGGFTLVLAEASWVPRFSSQCSASWSCRVGRYVIINQTRWKHATSSWNRARGTLRGYRHMVVNHEVGHWLGRGHAGCPGRGRLAPVMMTQSKDLRGCRFNPFPTRGEL